ncbi:MAG: GNAT family N-acetyltransferase [Kordiimonadaceae bacterium]|nr:GNAT family N-acetyltransferase [Kordiimonadaceae bacterium]MBO6569781.1 GNAT family N-acetyltransferase [Kordiimonadaceae bacterium]MBO6966316.1 GNAT family N-acetyltransferase [Kordiimonadaceae bacterium]
MEIRLAEKSEISQLKDLIAKSARVLCQKDYSTEQVEAALKGAWAVDTQLLEDKTYFVCVLNGKVIGCGGWSYRTTLFGGDAFDQRDAQSLDPAVDNAKIRAFFVDPDFIGHNVGQALLEKCETEASKAGFKSYELMATLTGARFYARHGYVGDTRESVELSCGTIVDFIPMTKPSSA